MRLYLDGVEIGSLEVSGTVVYGYGVGLSSDSETLDGLLDEVEIYDRTLSASEVQSIFNAGNDGKCKPMPLIPRYRVYNPYNFHHHYTTDPNEYNVLGSIGWVQEGAACYLHNEMVTTDSVDAVPFYRLYNPNSYEHHWTTDANEYHVLGTIGWLQEGADGYVFATQVTDSEPLYRLYNPNNGLHLWTMDANEKNVLIGYGFIDEGIACYVFRANISIGGYLQYRTFSDAGNQYRGWLEFTKDGKLINESEISHIKLHDNAGSPVSISSYTYYASSYFLGKWNDLTSSVEFSGPFHYSGFSVGFPDETNLFAGNYTYEATTNHGDLLFVTKYIPGETILPVVDVTSMNYEWLSVGDLRLRWSIPVGNYDEFRIVLVDQDWDDFSYVKLPADKDELIIPSEYIKQGTDYKNPSLVRWQVQTRSYTNTVDHNQYARGLSDWVEIAGDDSTAIAWIEVGTIIPYHYSGGVLSGMTFHRKFEVTSGFGNVQIRATLKDRSDSVDIIDEFADTFPVVESTEYEVLVYAEVSGQGLCSPFDTDKMIFSSPSASTTSEITIMPQFQQNPVTGAFDWYCVRNYAIDSITLN
jgi:hypothetical protein